MCCLYNVNDVSFGNINKFVYSKFFKSFVKSMSVNNIPPKLKPLASYLKTANEFESRDPVVSYYCKLYAVQRGMELDRSSPDSKKFLMELMDSLDTMKKNLKDNESVSNELVGQAHVEEYALRLFSVADKRDREGNFEQATIRSFMTSGFLMDVLGVFGEVGEDLEKCRKYAKWKAVYINQCLKNGETPHSGPLEDGQDFTNVTSNISTVPTPSHPPNPVGNAGANQAPVPIPRSYKPGIESNSQPPNESSGSYFPDTSPPQPSSGGLSPEDFTKAEKLCKYAASALQYQDSATAINYLTECLQLLKGSKK